MSIYRLKDGTECTIRMAVEWDSAEVVSYSNTVGGESDFLSYGRNEFSQSVEHERQIIREYSQAKNCLFIVAVIDGQICGALTFWGNSRKRLEHWGEFGISVSKQYWNRGIGQACLRYMLDWAQKGGIIRKIDLMVREDNYPAVTLYKKMGFEVEGTIRRAMKIGDRFYNFLYMGKLID